MTQSSAGWLPRTGISSGTLRSVIEYGIPLLFYADLRREFGIFTNLIRLKLLLDCYTRPQTQVPATYTAGRASPVASRLRIVLLDVKGGTRNISIRASTSRFLIRTVTYAAQQ